MPLCTLLKKNDASALRAGIDKSQKRLKMYFLLSWRLAGAWENSFVVLFFIGAHADLASAMWKGSSQELWEEALLGEYEVVVLGWVAVRRLAIVTSFVAGISCGSVIVGQIEVINHNPPPFSTVGWSVLPKRLSHGLVLIVCLPFLHSLFCVHLLFFPGSSIAAAVQSKEQREQAALRLHYILKIFYSEC